MFFNLYMFSIFEMIENWKIKTKKKTIFYIEKINYKQFYHLLWKTNLYYKKNTNCGLKFKGHFLSEQNIFKLFHIKINFKCIILIQYMQKILANNWNLNLKKNLIKLTHTTIHKKRKKKKLTYIPSLTFSPEITFFITAYKFSFRVIYFLFMYVFMNTKNVSWNLKDQNILWKFTQQQQQQQKEIKWREICACKNMVMSPEKCWNTKCLIFSFFQKAH